MAVHAVLREAALLNAEVELAICDRYLQHGDVTVLLHCVGVALVSLRIFGMLRLRCRKRALIRGALLHDFFLYDWHEPRERMPGEKLHAFEHPYAALRNARARTSLTPLEEDIISHHMFPVTIAPPRSREALIVSVADKLCAFYETVSRNPYPGLRDICQRELVEKKQDVLKSGGEESSI